MFCVFCATNTGFVQCYSLGSHKVCCMLVLYFALFSNFCFACFASQTSGLCSAFPSASVKSVTRFCCPLVRTLFCVFCLTKTGFVQCYSLGSRQVCCMLVFILLYSLSKFLLCVFCLTNIGLVQCFSLRLPLSLHPFGFLCFIQVAFVMCALPNKLRFLQ